MPQIYMQASERSSTLQAISAQKNALAEARAHSDIQGFYWPTDATLCSSAVFSVCFVKTM